MDLHRTGTMTPENTGSSHPTATLRPTRAERRLAAERAEMARLKLRQEAEQERAFRDAEWAREQARIRDEMRRQRDASRALRRTQLLARLKVAGERARRTLVMVGAIVGVNLVAVTGQIAAFHDGLGWSLPGAMGTAAVLESIAVFVGWHAHVALIEGDTVFRLRAASYGIALVVGGLNYHHYAPDWSATDKAVMFGMASLLSPWLWAIHSRHQHRKQLRESGLIDPRAPKFSALRWILHTRETWRALKWAVRHGEQSPAAAIEAVQAEVAGQDKPQHSLKVVEPHTVPSLAALPPRPPLTRFVWPERDADDFEDAAPDVATGPTPAPTSDAPGSVDGGEGANEPTRPNKLDNRDAEEWIWARCRGRNGQGRKPTQAEVVAKFGWSHGWAGLRIQAVQERMTARGYLFEDKGVVISPTRASTSGPPQDERPEHAEVVAEGGQEDAVA